MKRAIIDPEKCNNCDVCIVNEQCPEKAIIREEKTDKPWVDFYKCRGCMKCRKFCEHSAVIEALKPCNGGFASSW